MEFLKQSLKLHLECDSYAITSDKSTSVQVMAWCLNSIKPLAKLMLIMAQVDNQMAPLDTWVKSCFDALVQDCSISIASTLEIQHSCAKPSVSCMISISHDYQWISVIFFPKATLKETNINKQNKNSRRPYVPQDPPTIIQIQTASGVSRQ